MRYAVLSDVHANIEALGEVLKDVHGRNVEGVLFLGDAVGYGPDPNEAVSALGKNCSVLLAGNHDRAALGLADIESFNPVAKAAILWTAEALSEENKLALKRMPIMEAVKKDDILLVHSTPKSPEEWHYLLTFADAEDNFGHFIQRICLLGHSHMPFIVERLPGGELHIHKGKCAFQEGSRYIVNAGSVGQPRDRDSRACYALLDDEGVELIRVAYRVAETQRKMKKAGLPEPLIERLSLGM